MAAAPPFTDRRWCRARRDSNVWRCLEYRKAVSARRAGDGSCVCARWCASR